MGEPEGFVWQFLRKLWRSPESMTGGIGITFRLMNQGVCVCLCVGITFQLQIFPYHVDG